MAAIVISGLAALNDNCMIRANQPPMDDDAGVPVDIEQPFKELKNSLVASFERAYVEKLIVATKGNIAAAARKARIDRMYLYKLLDRYEIDAASEQNRTQLEQLRANP